MRSSRSISACVCLSLLSGCAAFRSTAETAVDYNRAFANSRNEMLVLNILRAGAKEPLQFSAMGTVTGGVRNNGSITIPLTGLVNAGPFGSSPQIAVNDGVNPQITVVPLGQKEFTNGILKPVSPETLDLFLAQGSRREVILPLLIGGLECADNQVAIMDGYRNQPASVALAEVAASSESFTLDYPDPKPLRTVTLPVKEGLAVLKDGLGSRLDPKMLKSDDSEKITLSIREKQSASFANLNLAPVCIAAGRTAAGVSATDDPDQIVALAPGQAKIPVILRSPAAMFLYLGTFHRSASSSASDCNRPPEQEQEPIPPKAVLPTELVKIIPCDFSAPVDAAIVTRFRGRTYYVPRTARATLETLSFLSDLISLQTSESTLTTGAPIVAVQGQ